MEDSIAVFDLVTNNEILPAMVAVATVFAWIVGTNHCLLPLEKNGHAMATSPWVCLLVPGDVTCPLF